MLQDFFQFTPSSLPHSVPGVDSASNRNEYQEYSCDILGGKRWPARKVDNLTALYEPIV
jgi:hypothetical protein